MRTWVAVSSAVVASLLGLALAQDAPPPAEGAAAASQAPKNKLDAPSKDVEIKAEMRLIEEVAKRRA